MAFSSNRFSARRLGVTHDGRRIADDNCVCRYVASDHGAGTDHCAAAYRDARENNGAGADGCSLFNVRPKEPVGVSFASRKLVVAESGVRTYEDIIIDP